MEVTDADEMTPESSKLSEHNIPAIVHKRKSTLSRNLFSSSIESTSSPLYSGVCSGTLYVSLFVKILLVESLRGDGVSASSSMFTSWRLYVEHRDFELNAAIAVSVSSKRCGEVWRAAGVCIADTIVNLRSYMPLSALSNGHEKRTERLSVMDAQVLFSFPIPQVLRAIEC